MRESRWGRHGQDYKNADAASFPQHIKSKTTITSVGEFRYWHARATPTVCDFDEGVRKAEEEKKAAEEKAAREAAMLVDTPEMDEFGNVLGALGDVFGALETSPLFARLTAEGGTRAKRRGSFVTSSLDVGAHRRPERELYDNSAENEGRVGFVASDCDLKQMEVLATTPPASRGAARESACAHLCIGRIGRGAAQHLGQWGKIYTFLLFFLPTRTAASASRWVRRRSDARGVCFATAGRPPSTRQTARGSATCNRFTASTSSCRLRSTNSTSSTRATSRGQSTSSGPWARAARCTAAILVLRSQWRETITGQTISSNAPPTDAPAGDREVKEPKRHFSFVIFPNGPLKVRQTSRGTAFYEMPRDGDVVWNETSNANEEQNIAKASRPLVTKLPRTTLGWK